ncbi:hypothetical protein Ddye_004554 [Dipteronia dyeriana]|uniref:Reverse transcriptase domain-containing protein n=1 Tax=Dipteronia dyeriana TaxID=168575 RepID=A0AAE0CWE9_9ROSI|nr:hypothetical protein Ddye_004554 [Dipteronia dyeriana]
MDNVMVVFEWMHVLRQKVKGKRGFMALKLDVAKAYDRVEWIFLEGMMCRLGFSKLWISKIMDCVSTVTYSFIFNGSIRGDIRPSRGLRQGDPLSPYMFVICAEGFSRLIKRASAKECVDIRRILEVYSSASGQLVNFNKSTVCFSKQVNLLEKLGLAESLTMKVVDCHESYSGSFLEFVNICREAIDVKYFKVLCVIWLRICMGLVPAIVELDALTVVAAIQSQVTPYTDVGVIFHDIIREAPICEISSFGFVPHLANMVAHCLDYVSESLW